MHLLSVTLILFLIMDPVGNISTFLRLMKGVSPARERFIILREMGIALITMLLFYFIGDALLDVLKIDSPTIYISSGIILFLMAIRILFPSSNSLRSNLQVKEGQEPFVVPLAIPLIAGPSILVTIMLYSHPEDMAPTVLTGILISWTLSSLILFFAHPLQRILKSSGLIACERLMGMVLVLLSIQRLLEGIYIFCSQRPS